MNYSIIPSEELIAAATKALGEHGIETHIVATKEDALAKIKELIPAGSSIMNGSSRTLEQVGFVDFLKSGKHAWNNLHAGILAEPDKVKQAELRKQALLSNFYLGSVHAISATGEMVVASNTGSQLPHIVYTSPNIIFVAGAQKIVPTLEEAMHRLYEYVVPLEDQRMIQAHGVGTAVSKIVIFNKENPSMGRKVRLILVRQELGF